MLAGHIPSRGRIELVDIPEPTLSGPNVGADQILFEPHLSCLCGSDLPYFDSPHTEYPQPIGYSLHEMIGTVVATNGQRFAPATACWPCRSGSADCTSATR